MTDQIARRPLRILLADAATDSRGECTRILERLGHRVRAAAGGLEAIALLREGSWDVVLADRDLPGAPGVEVLERAIDLQPRALRLLMTASVDARLREDAVARARVAALIVKPMRPRTFGIPEDAPPGEVDVRVVGR